MFVTRLLCAIGATVLGFVISACGPVDVPAQPAPTSTTEQPVTELLPPIPAE